MAYCESQNQQVTVVPDWVPTVVPVVRRQPVMSPLAPTQHVWLGTDGPEPLVVELPELEVDPP